MRLELTQLRGHGWSREAGNEYLTGVDVNGSVLASVVNLEDAIAEFGVAR
jgi:hypothetical protein